VCGARNERLCNRLTPFCGWAPTQLRRMSRQTRSASFTVVRGKKEKFSEGRSNNLRAPPRRSGRTSRRLSTMGVTPPNFATNRARKRSKMLRLVTLNFVENFSSAPLELFLLWLLSHTKPKNRGG
jgi:hypothetical protein